MEQLILAIDQGTGGTKTVLFDDRGRIVAKASVPLESSYPKVGFVEQDPVELYNNVITSVRNCMRQAEEARPGAADNVTAAGISNQRETFLLWDDSGAPLCNAVVWQCKRSTEICERLKGTSVEAEVRTRTGLIIDPYFSGTKLTWLVENKPDIKSAVRSGKARFGTIDSWTLFNLTNGGSYFTDSTNASRTLLFNIHTLKWDQTLIKALGVEGLVLPEVSTSSARFGESDFNGILPKPIPITGLIGDSHAAAFGEGCFSPGEAKATLGTGSSILCNIGGKPVGSDQGMVTTLCWALPGRTDYALEGVIVTCGATVKWLRDQLGLIDSSSAIESMAKGVDDNGGVYLLPAFSGMGAPYWKMDVKGAIVGLTFGSTRNHVARAALESVAFQIKDVIVAMETDSKTPLSRLKLDGGMTANTFLMQMVADLLGVRTETMGLEEVSALGAAYMAGLETGTFESLDSLAFLQTGQTVYEPGDREQILNAYDGWRAMVAKHC